MITYKEILNCGWEKFRAHAYCIVTPMGTEPNDSDWYLESNDKGRTWQIDDGNEDPVFSGTILDEEHLKKMMDLNNIKA